MTFRRAVSIEERIPIGVSSRESARRNTCDSLMGKLGSREDFLSRREAASISISSAPVERDKLVIRERLRDC